MKLLFLTCTLLVCSSLYANNEVICPELKGDFHCVVTDGTEANLRIQETRKQINGDENDVRYDIIGINQTNNLTLSTYLADGIGYTDKSVSACIRGSDSFSSIVVREAVFVDRSTKPERVYFRRYDKFSLDKDTLYYTKEIFDRRENEMSWIGATCTRM